MMPLLRYDRECQTDVAHARTGQTWHKKQIMDTVEKLFMADLFGRVEAKHECSVYTVSEHM